mgnify:CR=1 FL=1
MCLPMPAAKWCHKLLVRDQDLVRAAGLAMMLVMMTAVADRAMALTTAKIAAVRAGRLDQAGRAVPGALAAMVADRMTLVKKIDHAAVL